MPKVPTMPENTDPVWTRDSPGLALGPADQQSPLSGLTGNWDALVTAIGSVDVTAGLINQVSVLGSPGNALDAEASNFVIGLLDAMGPRDAVEALLIAQMAAVHQAAMAMGRRLNRGENPQQREAAERALNKLTRTYTGQVEALKRYRSTGQQVVRVERVTVESGAQAVVGTVNHGGAGNAD